jgi:hypothetical protein
VVYSGVVRAAVREFAAAARAAGRSREAAAALTDLDRRLHIYPQFGEPILDLTQKSGQVCVAAVPPLLVRYAIYEERRLVVVTLLRILPEPDA